MSPAPPLDEDALTRAGDDSRPFDAGPSAWLSVAIPADERDRPAAPGGPIVLERRGEVVATERSADAAAPARIELREPGPGRRSTFFLRLPRSCPLPLAAGEQVTVRLRRQLAGLHPVEDALIVDASGELLVATVESGDLSFAPGWSASVGDAARVGPMQASGMARRIDCWLHLSHNGRTALVACNRWRHLETSDGEWVVTGLAERWGPGAALPADATAAGYHTFRILRLRGPG